MSKQPYMLSNNNKSCTFSEFFRFYSELKDTGEIL